jgi:hypothetical protein
MKMFNLVDESYNTFYFSKITDLKNFIKKENLKDFSIYLDDKIVCTIKNNSIKYCTDFNILDPGYSLRGRFLKQIQIFLKPYAKIDLSNKALINTYINQYVKYISFFDEIGNYYKRKILKDDKVNKKALIKFNNKLVTIFYQ